MRTQLGKYAITRQLGKGVTGSVYLAYDDFLKSDVAIKVADQSLFDGSAGGIKLQSMLLNEIALAGRLKHPFVIELFDAGIEEQDLYIIMEYFDGQMLSDCLREQGALTLADVHDIVFKACNALAYAEEQGIMHRDIKPDNIMVRQKPSGGYDVRLLDFGASFSQGTARKQIDGVVGSMAYISPEMLQGKAADFRSDIFSMGVMMYQLVTGQLPYSASSPKALYEQILHQTPPPIEQQLPEAYKSIIQRCLEKNPEDRFQNWGELEYEMIFAHYMSNDQQEIADPQEMHDADKFFFLKQLKFFSDMEDRKIWELISICYWYQLPPGETVLVEGEKGDAIYLLVKGTLTTSKKGQTLNEITPGYIIGEVAYILGEAQVRTASINCKTESIIIEIEAEDLALASDSLREGLQKIMLKILSERLDKVTSMVAKST